MDKPITSGLKVVFLVHAVVGLIFGLGYLVIPETLVGWFNMPLTDEPYLRLIGAAILGYAATSTVGYRAHNWDEVKIVVQGEFVWTGLAATLSLWFVLDGTWPAAGWLALLLDLLIWIIDAALLWFGSRTFRRTRLALEM